MPQGSKQRRPRTILDGTIRLYNVKLQAKAGYVLAINRAPLG